MVLNAELLYTKLVRSIMYVHLMFYMTIVSFEVCMTDFVREVLNLSYCYFDFITTTTLSFGLFRLCYVFS